MGYNEIMKIYTPKRKKYHTLKQFRLEMIENKVKIVDFDGFSVTTKNAVYTLFDGKIYGEVIDGKE